MSQAVLRPNLTKKFQWEVSQIADKERSLAPLYRWFKCKLKPPKKEPCRRFQRGWCNYGLNCKFEHRCTICNKYGHGAHLCRKRVDRTDESHHHDRDRKNDRYHFYKTERSESKTDSHEKKNRDKKDRK